MINYLEYIYRGFFVDLQYEEIELITDFFADIENKNLFQTSEAYQLGIISLINKNDLSYAKNILKLAKKTYPNDETFSLLGAIIETKENPQKAIKLCDKYYKEHGNYIFILLKSIILFDLKQYEKGDKQHNIFVKNFIEEKMKPGAYLQIALFLNSDRYEVIEEPETEFMIRSVVITENVRKALKYKFDIEFLLQCAANFYAMNNVQEAKNIVNKVIDTDAYNRDAWVMLSEILFNDEQYVEAAEAYKYRIAINDGDNMNYFNCGVCYFKLGKWTEAFHYFKLQEKNNYITLADNKDFYGILKNMQADCLLNSGKVQEATALCLNVLDVDANNFNSMVKVAKCYHLMDNNNQAVLFLGKAIKTKCNYEEGDYENLFETVGDILVEISEDQEDKQQRVDNLRNAIYAYTQSLLFSNIPPRLKDNSVDFRDIERIRFHNATKMFKIGRAYFVIEDTINALVNFQLAYQEIPTLPRLALFLTFSYFKLNFYNEALMHYELIPADELEEAKAVFPNFEEIELFCKQKQSK